MSKQKAPDVRTSAWGGQQYLQSQVIDWLRFPLAVAVVFIHSFGPAPLDLASMHAAPLESMSLFNWLRICLSHVLTHIAVPTFFVISGFLFFRNWTSWDKHLYLSKMKSRFRTLLIPYLCWNVLAVLSVVCIKLAKSLLTGEPFLPAVESYLQDNGWLHLLWDNNVWAEDRLNWLGWATPMSGPADLPLWFLRDLIVMTVLTPLVYGFLKLTRHYGVLFLALAYISGVWPSLPGLNISAVFFFCIGAYFSIYGKNLVDECRRVRKVAYVLAAVFLLLCIWFDGRNTSIGCVLYPFYIMSGVCAAFNVAADWLERGRVRVHPLLSHSTFFIYALHTILVLAVCQAAAQFVIRGDGVWVRTILYLLVPFLCVLVCLGIFLFMKRFFPRLLGILTGNRF